jgi:hypothetical protein
LWTISEWDLLLIQWNVQIVVITMYSRELIIESCSYMLFWLLYMEISIRGRFPLLRPLMYNEFCFAKTYHRINVGHLSTTLYNSALKNNNYRNNDFTFGT